MNCYRSARAARPHVPSARRCLSLSLYLLIGGACTAPAPLNNAGLSTLSSRADSTFLSLGPNDIIRVDVLKHPELSSAPDGVRVDAEGMIHLPLVGEVSVQGLSLGRVNTMLVDVYAPHLIHPLVNASVLKYSSREFHLLGNLEKPGTITMDRPITALAALAKGGGYTRGADRESIFLLRPHGDTLEVHSFNAATPGPDGLVRVMPGDIIYVRQRGTQDFQEDLLPLLLGIGSPTLTAVTLANN